MSSVPGFTSRLFLSGSAAFILIGAVGAAHGAALPEFTRRFALSDWEAGLFITAWGTGAVLMVLLGTLGVRGLSARRSALMLAAGSGLIAAGFNWPLMLLGVFVAGCGFGITASHVNRAFMNGFGLRSPAMVGLVNAINGIGMISGPLLLVVAGGSAGVLYAGLVVFALLVLALYLPGDDAFAGATRGLPPLGWRELGLLSLITGSTVLEGALLGFSALALIAVGWAEDEAVLLVSAYFAMFFLGRLSLYWLTRWVAPGHLMLVSALGTALGTGLAAAGISGVGYVMTGAFVGMAFPVAYVWQTPLLGPDPRMASSLVLAGLSGGMIGPILFGGILALVGVEYLFAVAAFFGTILSLAVLRMISGSAPAAPPAPPPAPSAAV